MLTNRKQRNEQGIALISVLWALMLLSVMVLSVMTIVKVQSKYASNIGQKSRAVAIADAGIYLAIQRLSEPGAVRKISGKVTSLKLDFGGKDIEITIISESGKIDLNMSHEVLIAATLAFHGMSDYDANIIAEELRNLRESNSKKLFKIISDIRQFNGINDALFKCVEPYFTVYSNRLGVNYAAASDEMQKMIKWADKARWGGQSWLEVGGSTAGSLVSGTKSVLQQTGSFAGKAFTIQAKVALNDDVKVQRTAVIRITGDRHETFWVYRWATSSQYDNLKCITLDKK